MAHQLGAIETEAALRAMVDELRGAEAIYRPSRFWEFHGGGHLELLGRRGLEEFKQTLNASYYNWLPHTWDDNQLRNLLAFWCRRPERLPLLARFASRPTLEWVHPGAPLSSDEQRFIHALFVGLLWYYVLQTDRYSLLTRLEEPRLGAPLPIEIEGRLISQDLANSAREYNSLRGPLESGGLWDDRLTVGELGAGYGRLAYVFAKAAPGRYMIFDIPPTLHVAQWYLSRVCPEKRLFAFRHFDDFAEVEAELEAARLAFFTPNQLELFPDGYFTAFVSISSLAEMTREQVDRYKRLMAAKTRRMVYLKQWRHHYNAHDELRLDADEYTLREEWDVLASRADPVQDDFVEVLQCRGAPLPAWADAAGESAAVPEVVARLQRERAVLQQVADERLNVIRELEVACRERLDLIRELDSTCRERLELIERLDAANREQRRVIEERRARAA